MMVTLLAAFFFLSGDLSGHEKRNTVSGLQILQSDTRHLQWNVGSSQGGWSQKRGIFLTTTGQKKKKKALQNKQQPKKTTYCHPAKKSKCAGKTTTYGWVGCDQKEYSYHVLNIPFTDLSEKKFSRTEHGVVPMPVFFWKHNWGQ